MTCRADLGDVGVPPVGVDQRGHVQFGFGHAAAFLRLDDLPAGQANMRADDDQAVATGVAAGPDLLRGKRFLWFQARQRPDERRPGAVPEAASVFLHLQEPEDDDFQVGVVGGVDHDERAAGDPVQDLGDPAGAAEPDVVQGDAVHLVGGDGAVALLGDEVPQVGRLVTERRVLGEFRVPGWGEFPGHVGPVDVTGGEPAGLEVGGDQQHPVESGAGHAAPGGVDGLDLGDDVAAQRGVAAADDFHWAAETLAEGEQAGGHAGVQFDGGVFRQAAGVGQDEAGGPWCGQAGGVLVGFENSDDADVVHGLRAGGVVVEHGDTTAGGRVGGPDTFPRIGFVPHGRGGGEHFLGRRAFGVSAFRGHPSSSGWVKKVTRFASRR